MKTLAVVILNYNGKHYLEQFLPSVCAYSSEADVIVADNASTDDSISFLEQHYPSLQIIKLQENGGFSKGYNLALEQLKGKYSYYVLLNSDVEVTPSWLEAPLALLEQHKEVGACQPKLKDFYKKDTFEYAGAAGGFIDRLGYPFCRGRIFLNMEQDTGQYDQACKVFWASGACMFVRASLYHELGGLEEDFFAHMEEIDFCWRLQRAGYAVAYTPNSEIFHVGGGTLSHSNPRKTFLNFRNNLAMLAKNLSGTRLFVVLTIRLGLDTLAALKFLSEGKSKDAKAVLNAQINFYFNFFRWRTKRNSKKKEKNELLIWKRNLLFYYYVKKVKKFSALPYTPEVKLEVKNKIKTSKNL